MTEVISRCLRHKRNEEVTVMEVRDDGLLLTFKCGYQMKKFFSE